MKENEKSRITPKTSDNPKPKIDSSKSKKGQHSNEDFRSGLKLTRPPKKK